MEESIISRPPVISAPSLSHTLPVQRLLAAVDSLYIVVDVELNAFGAGRGRETASLHLEVGGRGVDQLTRVEGGNSGIVVVVEQVVVAGGGGAACEIQKLALDRLVSGCTLEHEVRLSGLELLVDQVFGESVHVHLQVGLDHGVDGQGRAVGGAVEFDAVRVYFLPS